ncbi:glycosyltransferase [Flavobacterium sp. DGU38]|uniref:Glycosyltransferase n=1 Tax=Flavobacterium calami TaxID=3139144 RepID=A0ABU9IP88_9FLAO
MKILVIYKGGFPNGLAMTKRLQLYVKGLKELKNDVRIVIPQATEKNGSKRNESITGNFEGVPFKYLSKSTERSQSFLLRRFFDFFDYLKLMQYILNKRNNFDVVFLIDVRDNWRIPIYFLSKLRGAKVIYELNEHPLVFSSKFKYWFERKIIFKLFDGYIVISENLKNLVETFKKSSCVLLKVPIITNTLVSQKADYDVNNQKNYIIHTGGLSDKKEGVIGLIKAIHYVKHNHNEQIDLFFTGYLQSSADRVIIEETIKKLELQENIKFLGYLSDAEVLEYQQNALLGLINKPDNLQNNFCFPTKLGEYMSIGKLVLATNVGEYMNYLKDGFNSIILEESTPECLGENIIKVLKNKEYYVNIGMNGKITADLNFNYKVQCKNIDSFINTLF